MKKILVVMLALAMVFALASCGGQQTVSTTVTEVEQGAAESAETGAPEAEAVAVGNKIATDFVEITITEASIANSIKTSIKSGNFTRTFGPDDSAETDFACIKGKIMNKSTASLQENIMAIAKVGDYTLEESDVYIYKSDGDTVWELSPLVEYNFMMYVEIPNSLVEGMESCNFNFGFNEGMESTFGEFGELAYKYCLTITPEATAPVPATAE